MATVSLDWGSTGVYERQKSNVSSSSNTGWVSYTISSGSVSYRRITIALDEVFGTASPNITKIVLTVTAHKGGYSTRGDYSVYATKSDQTVTQCKTYSQAIYRNTDTTWTDTVYPDLFDLMSNKFTYNGHTCIELTPHVKSNASSTTFTVTNVKVSITYEDPKGYVSFDSVFSYKKWKDAGITGANHLTISNISDTGFSATAGGSDSYTADSPIFQLTAGTAYVIEFDTSGGSSRECFVLYHSSASAGWSSFTSSYANSFEFTPPSGYPYISIRVDVNNDGDTINFSNFRIYPKGYDYMSTSVTAANRTRYESWSLPTPTRTGYNFDAWYTGLNGTGTKYTSGVPQPTVDTVLYSNWAIKTFQITSSAGTGGNITGSATVNYGSSKTFTITPNTGYQISDVKVDGTSVGAVSSYTFSNVTATHTIAATFALKTYTITATAGSHGSISPASASVTHGGSQTFTITPATGYNIEDVKVDGTSVGAVSSYTFSNVTAAHTISATFVSAQTRPYITSAAITYGGSQVGPSNKVPAGQGYIIRVEVIEQ